MPFRPPIHQARTASARPIGSWRMTAGADRPRRAGYDAAWRALRAAKLAADPLCWWC